MATVLDLITDSAQFHEDDPWGFDPIYVRLVESYEQLVELNPDLRIEQTSHGEIVFMSPTGSESGSRSLSIAAHLYNWTVNHGGIAFDSSTVFTLPNGAKRSPDASWIQIDRWNKLTSKEKKGFAPICPDFVVELRSESDRLKVLQEKLDEYMANGARLGWLIDPLRKEVHIYRPGKKPEILSTPANVSGEDVLQKFVLDLMPIWADR